MAQYFIQRDSQVFGPYTVDQLKDAARTNTLRPLDLIASTQQGRWLTADTVPTLEFTAPSTGITPPSNDNTVAIHQVFKHDPNWPLTQLGIKVELLYSDDGNPVYTFDIEELELVCFEITSWHDEEISRHSPRRLVIRTLFHGIEITNPMALLEGTHISRGFPSYGINEDGVMSMQIAIPISTEIPIDVLRGASLVFANASPLSPTYPSNVVPEVHLGTALQLALFAHL
mgnify:CR=1 FL=1